MQSTLVLNASTEPLNICSAPQAIKLILKDKAFAVDNSPKMFHSEKASFEVPYVIQLKEMAMGKRFGRVGFSRRGVLARDGFKCVYCGREATTIDHVIPQAMGGQNSYENCVAACKKCNNKKGCKSLEAMGWEINFKPKAPSPYTVLINKYYLNIENREAWAPHIEHWNAAYA